MPSRREAPARVRGSSRCEAISVAEVGSATATGTVRKANEDTISVKASMRAIKYRQGESSDGVAGAPLTPTPSLPQINPSAAPGEIQAFAACYDGHGGAPTAAWLQKNLVKIIESEWNGGQNITKVLTESYLLADKTLLTAKGEVHAKGLRSSIRESKGQAERGGDPDLDLRVVDQNTCVDRSTSESMGRCSQGCAWTSSSQDIDEQIIMICSRLNPHESQFGLSLFLVQK
jgi:hypothetical protein